MALHGRILLLQLSLSMVVVILAAAQALSPPQAKPGCTEKCGNLTIPYPFGIGKSCYREEGYYNIVCNISANETPQAHWAGGNLVISNFSLEEGEMQLLNYPSRDCYDAYGRTDYLIHRITLPNHFTLSDTKNKFVAVGCDTYAVFHGFRGEERFVTGCISYCSKLDSMELADSCSGAGCCQTNIPTGLKNYSISLSSYSNHSGIWDFNPCSYSLIVEVDHFKFSNTSFKELESNNKYPLVVNWAVGDPDQPDSCDAAQERQDYECKGNSTCANPINRNGYICRCMDGYEGNPYLGCQDIDECKASNPCTNGVCVNSPGDFSCLCDKRFKKGGKTDCIKVFKHNQSLFLISLGTGGSLVLLFLSIATWWFYKAMKRMKNRKRKEKFFKENGGLLLEQQLYSGEVNVVKTKLFNSKELDIATDHFNADRILGQGGQGTVYKGMLADGSIVAVKKSKIVSEGEVGQFINEIVILSQINHRNVVKLLGCCLETEVPLLVYEFLPNGTLYHYIQNQDEEFPLTWKERLQISIEVAGALSYLHSAASFPIYHRDIKTTNILLDDKYKAKVADFGTSKSISIDQTHLTTLVQGTFGYLDPEYFQSSQLTDKSDVYSFGVVLVELLTGEKPVSLTRSQESRSLAAYFLLSMEQNRLFDILNAQVMKDARKEEITTVANLAQRCLNLNGRKRPTMKEVAVELEGVRLVGKASIIQENLTGTENIQTHEVTWDVVSSSTEHCTTGGTGSSFDVQSPLLFSTQW